MVPAARDGSRVALAAISLLLAGCVARSTAAPPPTTPTVTAAPVTSSAWTLKPGDFYFSLNGKPTFVLSRNIAGYALLHDDLLGLAQSAGSKIARIQIDSLGLGYTTQGAVDENWARKWEQVFDQAQADGIDVLVVFSGWFDWNAGEGYSTWKTNPLNAANGGPIQAPAELFQAGSPAQQLWLQWMRTLVQRWQGRKNILAWEIFSEVNLASGATEPAGTAFVNSAASVIRAADLAKRPVTASLADTGKWPDFYRAAATDFINLHPYPPSGQLDRMIVSGVRTELAEYGKPVLIGESGLNAATPDSDAGKLTIAANAPIGIQHAIWAGLVSGALNGRALYWEDSYAMSFASLGAPFVQKYATAERAAANFAAGLDLSGYRPLTATTSSNIWGATVGNATSAIGWFRDAASEPPDWNVKPVISGGTVAISIPGSAAAWQVDFYDPRNGTSLVGSARASRSGSTVALTLPDFSDDLAFKMRSQK